MRTCIVCHKPIGGGHIRYCSDECADAITTKPKLIARMNELGITGYARVVECIFCKKKTTRGMYCSRACEIKQQVKTLGFTARRDGAA
jgi:hypothetical protein